MTLGDNFKQMNILHAALCIGCAIILFIMYTLVNQEKNAVITDNIIFSVIGIVIAFVNVLLSRVLFFMRTQPAQTINDFGQKINLFRAAFILQMALLEGAAIINVVFYFITKNKLHFFIAIGVLLLMIVRRPTRSMAAITLFSNRDENIRRIYEDDMEV